MRSSRRHSRHAIPARQIDLIWTSQLEVIDRPAAGQIGGYRVDRTQAL
jgi:hypothetical protein